MPEAREERLLQRVRPAEILFENTISAVALSTIEWAAA
jgi:hypothetical protein